MSTQNETIKTIRNSECYCVTHTGIPGYIFKTFRNIDSDEELENDIKKYVARAEKARKICEDNDLYLIHIPVCKMEIIDGIAYIREEMVDLLTSDWNETEVLYQSMIHDPELEEYAYELMKQLTIFVCLMKFADVKYDNILISKTGEIVLFDLDENNALTGLCHGGGRDNVGIFHIIPLGWFDDFSDFVKTYLNNEDFESFSKSLEKLKKHARKKKERIENIEKIYKLNNIQKVHDLLIYDEKRIEGDKKIKKTAEILIKHINLQIEKLKISSLIIGRQVPIDNNSGDDFYIEIQKANLKEKVEEAVIALQKAGYIDSYSCPDRNIRSSSWFWIVC